MHKALFMFRSSYKFFALVFVTSTLPFALIKHYGALDLKELPFMFIAILGLIKFYMAKALEGPGAQSLVKKKLPSGVSKQEIVNKVSLYKSSQDAALLVNLVLILILNIYL